jgi:hypothetical protein
MNTPAYTCSRLHSDPEVSSFIIQRDRKPLYRGAQPTYEEFKTLAKMGVKTVIDLLAGYSTWNRIVGTVKKSTDTTGWPASPL